VHFGAVLAALCVLAALNWARAPRPVHSAAFLAALGAALIDGALEAYRQLDDLAEPVAP
jgi:hypothetical protein